MSGSAVIKSGTLEIQGDGYASFGGRRTCHWRFFRRPIGGTLFLDGGTIEGGSLIIEKGGNLEVSAEHRLSAFPKEVRCKTLQCAAA